MSRVFLNQRTTLIDDALTGLMLSTPHNNLARLDIDPAIRVVIRSDWDKSRVAVISGGGSGHEPAHAGFVGKGMLTAAVCGDLFASPSVDAIFNTIIAVTGDRGCLLIVKNYTGDRLNFGLAAERARQYGLKVAMVIVADDIALPDNPQPRGLAGTVLVHKIAGYAAEQGKSLDEVQALASQACENVFSIGAALRSATLPDSDAPERIKPGEIELGLGIHGEPGAMTLTARPAQTLVNLLVEYLHQACDSTSRLAVLLNNLGGTSELEMCVLTTALMHSPLAAQIDLLIGPATLVSSLDMKGFSLSVLRLDAPFSEALRAPVEVATWRQARVPGGIDVVTQNRISSHMDYIASDSATMHAVVESITVALIASEKTLNTLDARIGDGDTGTTYAAGARDIAQLLHDGRLPLAQPDQLMKLTGERLATVMGGSSGVLMSIFFTHAGEAMRQGACAIAALQQGLEQIQYYGGARLGDRTLIDALQPALAVLLNGGSLAEAARAASNGAEATATMTKASVGRAAYLNSERLQGVTDPGAAAVAAVFSALANYIRRDA